MSMWFKRPLAFIGAIAVLVASAVPILAFEQTALADGETYTWGGYSQINASGGGFVDPVTFSAPQTGPTALPNQPVTMSGVVHLHDTNANSGICETVIRITVSANDNTKGTLQAGGASVGNGTMYACSPNVTALYNGKVVAIGGTRPTLGETVETDQQKTVTVGAFYQGADPNAGPPTNTFTVKQNGKVIATQVANRSIPPPSRNNNDPTASYSTTFKLDAGDYQFCGDTIGGCKNATKVKYQPLTVTLNDAPTTGTIPVKVIIHYASGANDAAFKYGPYTITLKKPDGTFVASTVTSMITQSPYDQYASGNPISVNEVTLTAQFKGIPLGDYRGCLVVINRCQDYKKISNPSPEMVFDISGEDAQKLVDAANPKGGPKCAVQGLGLIQCPANIGPGTQNCYTRDPMGDKPDEWVLRGCDSVEFTKASTPPAAVDCSGKGVDVPKSCDTSTTKCNGQGNCDIVRTYIDPAIKALSALVGVGVTVAIVLGAIQYASSGDNGQAVSAAKRRITIAILTLIGYFLFYAFLNWIIPGGL